MRQVISGFIAALLCTLLLTSFVCIPSGAPPGRSSLDTTLLEHAIRVVRSYENDDSYLLGEIAIRTIFGVVLCLQRASDSADQVQTIKATVVAYDLGVEQADRSCKQTAIARAEKSLGRNESDRYFIIRHQSSCPQLIPEEILKADRKRSINLKRDTKCDQTLGELKYFSFISPTGVRTESPRLKTVRGWDEIRVRADKKLPCYILTSPEPFEK